MALFSTPLAILTRRGATRAVCCRIQIIRALKTNGSRYTTHLPPKVPMHIETTNGFTEKKTALADNDEYVRDIKQAVGSTYGGNYSLKWMEKPHNVLILKKPNDVKSETALIEIATWLHSTYPDLNIIVEPEVADTFKEKLPFVYVVPHDQKSEYSRTIDLAITLGGDGTILHLSSLFPHSTPPIISFSLGTLGFLIPFHFSQYKTALSEILRGKMSLLMRMRLTCSLHQPNGARIWRDGKEIGSIQVMNEVNLHRGRHPSLTSIDCYVNGEYLTEAVADGLIVATPTGSTAYSLSAGGPIVHPSVQSLLLTPICPRSLSFRTVLLPPDVSIQLKIGESSRSTAEVSFDGREVYTLNKGEYLEVRMSNYPIPCVNRVDVGVDFVRFINDLLKWNQNFENKLLRHGVLE
ncbi:uncharacterized protein VTP21DRAFT_9252 [Calcarisporiella thermophila]|uniref:uncharacterized protein n=1 Tax=Calcarisporiella thermophila TaxID=911321 RepID=UPI003743AD81